MKIGYLRYSEFSQSIDDQARLLRNAGCDQLFSDIDDSGSGKSWPGLGLALRTLEPDDSLVVSSLDRLARSLSQLIGVMELLRQRRAILVSLAEQLECGSSQDEFIRHLYAISSFHRQVLKERTRGGYADARKRGLKVGPRSKLTPDQIEWARAQRTKGMSLESIARELNVSNQTIRRRLRDGEGEDHQD